MRTTTRSRQHQQGDRYRTVTTYAGSSAKIGRDARIPSIAGPAHNYGLHAHKNQQSKTALLARPRRLSQLSIFTTWPYDLACPVVSRSLILLNTLSGRIFFATRSLGSL